MTAIVKAKPEYKCLENENIYRAVKSNKSCYNCSGYCPHQVRCDSCGEVFKNSEVRRRAMSGMNPANKNKDKYERHVKCCAACFDSQNALRLAETERCNIRHSDRSNNPHGERWEVRHVKVPFQASELFGPEFGHQVLIRHHIILTIDDEVQSTYETTGDVGRKIRQWVQAVQGWESIETLRQRS
tara:strand:+ start:492 stop:1046 length:555 start_codon:yes stop_codon:yes gene_type:complete